ncbi:MAG: TonB family protein, partial [Prolixibacteraceae bacterium]|nr:TonB family protein [Prolixibacteraceae bacterium]
MKKSNKQFLKLPEYPGGKEAFKKYIKSNLVYPQKALEKRVEGTVFVIAEIDDNGNVLQIEIEKGIGSGCDEEAGRLIKNIRFGGVKN